MRGYDKGGLSLRLDRTPVPLAGMDTRMRRYDRSFCHPLTAVFVAFDPRICHPLTPEFVTPDP